MPKTLLIMRHGEAASGAPDIERTLTDSGINEVIRAGRYLQGQGVILQQLLHSNAERTRATAEYLAQLNRFDSSILAERADFYQSTVGSLLQSIHELDNSLEAIGIVGHNPTLSYIVEYLATNADNIYLGTANMVLLTFEAESWVEIEQYSGRMEWKYQE